ARINPATATYRVVAYGPAIAEFGGVSTAQIVAGNLWLTSNQMDRSAWLPLPGLKHRPTDRSDARQMRRQAGKERVHRIKSAEQLFASAAGLGRPIRRQRSGELGLAFEDHAVV